jgi:hypothetical protein
MNIYHRFLDYVLEYLFSANGQIIVSTKRIKEFMEQKNLSGNFSERTINNFLWRILKKIKKEGYLKIYKLNPKVYTKTEKFKKIKKKKIKKNLRCLF